MIRFIAMEDIEIIWGPLRSLLRERCTSHRIVQILSPTGLDMPRLAKVPLGNSTEEKNQLMTEVDEMYGEMEKPQRERFLRIATEELLSQKPDLKESLDKYLRRLGWKIHEGVLIPIPILDVSELEELPPDAHTDLLKAAERLRDGDLSGAVSAACGAVDSVTGRIYREKGLGDPNRASFQKRVIKSLRSHGVLPALAEELQTLGWGKKDAERFSENLHGSINQAAFVMQTLRSHMGDVHGTKPILKPLVFDTLKWATIVVRLLNEE